MRLTPFPSRTKSQARVDPGRYTGVGGCDVAGHVSEGPLIREGDSWALPRLSQPGGEEAPLRKLESWRASHLYGFTTLH